MIDLKYILNTNRTPRDVMSAAPRTLGMVVIAALFFAGCSSTGSQIQDDQWNDLEQGRLPVLFNPPLEMTLQAAQQASQDNGRMLTSDISYVGAEQTTYAKFLVQDLLDPDRVFIDTYRQGDRLEDYVRQTHEDNVKALGKSGGGARSDYQQYLLKDDRACIMAVKYSGSDGAGDLTTGGTAVGSVSIFADICEPGTEQLSAQRIEAWMDSFRYQQR